MRHALIAAIVLLLPGAAPDLAAAKVDQRIRGFFEAHNSGDAAHMQRFYDEAATDSFRARRDDAEDRALYERLWGDMGRLELIGLDVEAGGSVTAVARSERMPEPVTFRFRLEADPPHRIDGFSVMVGGPPGREPDALPPLEIGDVGDPAAVAAALESYLGGLAARDAFSGAVLVVQGGKPVFHRGFGMADREAGRAAGTGTRFDVGSITKMFTKVAVGQLLRDGKLKLGDTILDHLPDYPDKEIARKITVEQLLEHRSGLGDIFNERWESTPRDGLVAPRDFFPLFTGRPLQFEPGTGRRYSNAGYIVLGAIVEAASGMRYDAYLAARVFEPAGMTASGFPVRDGSNPALAIGYTRQGPGSGSEGRRRNLGMLPVRGCPAGSSMHTAEDLWKFDRALRSGKLLGAAWTSWVFTGVPPGPGEGSPRALAEPVAEPLGIAGGGPGVSAVLESDGDTAVIVLSNLDPPAAERLGMMLYRRLSGGGSGS